MTRYLTRREAAEFTRLKEGTLRNMAAQSRGPAYFKGGGKVLYRAEDLEAWIERRGVDPERQDAGQLRQKRRQTRKGER